MSLENLNNPLFENDDSREAFGEILDILDNITPLFIEREEFESMRWEFLVESWEDKFWKKYNLYLPKDLKINETPSIILRVNKITFWENLPEYSSTQELKVKIVDIFDKLLKKLNSSNEIEIRKALKKYYLLYEQLFWTSEANKLNKPEYRSEILSVTDYNWYRGPILKIQTQENLWELLEEVEDSMSQELSNHFLETFFENGVNMLRYGLMTLTREEFEEIKLKSETWEEEINTSKVVLENLDIEEQRFRDKIWIDDLKLELEEARKTNDKELIIKLEKKATNKILETLYTTYPYQFNSDRYWYNPNGILESKEMYCVWFSLVWHSFLSELDIKHNWLNIPIHSALEVFIWGKSYYFDATYSSKIYELKWWKFVKNDGRNWTYRKFSISMNEDINFFIHRNIAISWDPDIFFFKKVLLPQILNNKWNSLNKKWDYDLWIEVFDIAMNIDSRFAELYSNKWNSLNKKWDYDWSIEMIDKAIGINPNFAVFHNNKWAYLFNKWDYDWAIEMYDKVIEINPKFEIAYYNKWISLFHKWDYDWSIEIYDKAIEINPKFKYAYFNKWFSFKKLNRKKESSLNIFVYNLLKNSRDWIFDFDLLYRKEKKEIRRLFKEKDFEWIRLYLLSIES